MNDNDLESLSNVNKIKVESESHEEKKILLEDHLRWLTFIDN